MTDLMHSRKQPICWLVSLCLVGCYGNELHRSRAKSAVGDMSAAAIYLEVYRNNYGDYPSGDWSAVVGRLDLALSEPWHLQDPWKTVYDYAALASMPDGAAGYRLVSLGSDKKRDGGGERTSARFDPAQDLVIETGEWAKDTAVRLGSTPVRLDLVLEELKVSLRDKECELRISLASNGAAQSYNVKVTTFSGRSVDGEGALRTEGSIWAAVDVGASEELRLPCASGDSERICAAVRLSDFGVLESTYRNNASCQ